MTCFDMALRKLRAESGNACSFAPRYAVVPLEDVVREMSKLRECNQEKFMNAYRYSVAMKKGLGGEFLPRELDEAMRMCGEGLTVEACIAALQAKRDRKTKGRA